MSSRFAGSVAVLLLLALAGCSGGVHKAGNDLLTNHYYSKDGYRIDSPYGMWVHKAGANQDSVSIGMGYERKDLTDQDRDGKVDIIDLNDQRFIRGDRGSEGLFTEADAELAKYKLWMHVDETDAAWRAMSATDLAKRAGYGKY